MRAITSIRCIARIRSACELFIGSAREAARYGYCRDVILAQVAQERFSRDKCEAMKTIIYYDGSRQEVSGSYTLRELTFYALPCLLRSRWSYEREEGAGNESGFAH